MLEKVQIIQKAPLTMSYLACVSYQVEEPLLHRHENISLPRCLALGVFIFYPHLAEGENLVYLSAHRAFSLVPVFPVFFRPIAGTLFSSPMLHGLIIG